MKKKKLPNLVLDSCALLAFYQKEKGADKIKKFLQQASQGKREIYLNLVNLGEIYYRLYRTIGETIAEEKWLEIKNLPLKIIEPSEKLIQEAARFKGKYPIAYADCFAAATAKLFQSSLVTCDPEFKKLKKEIKLIWF